MRGAQSKPFRTLLAYALFSLAAIAVGVGVLVLIEGGDNHGNAHINQASGSTNGVEPDDREGKAPPPLAIESLREASTVGGCDLRLSLADEGHRHLSWSNPRPRYRTRPPTSGDHIETPYQQADGAYAETPPQVAVVHSLEHGRLAIEYQPSLPAAQQLELIGLYDTMWGGTLIFPNPDMPYRVAAVTWTNLLGCRRYRGPATLDAIREFGRRTWGKFGGEPVNGFALKGPTP